MTDLLLAALDHVSGMPVLKSIYVIQSDYAFYFWQGAYQNLKKNNYQLKERQLLQSCCNVH